MSDDVRVRLTDDECLRIVQASIHPGRLLAGQEGFDGSPPDLLLDVVREVVTERMAQAWSEGANAAVEPVNTGTRMTLRAVVPFPSNPYRTASDE